MAPDTAVAIDRQDGDMVTLGGQIAEQRQTGRVLDGGRYPLAEARRAHEDLRARRTTGKLTLDCATTG